MSLSGPARDARDHRAALRTLPLAKSALEPLAAYLDLLAGWSRRANLTGAVTPEQRVGVLVAPVLFAVPLLEPGRLLDVGSGNGSPGLVLALLRPDLAVALLEPRQRRWAFLREAVRAAGRPEIEVLRERHDTYQGPPAQNVTLRALRLPLAALERLIAPGGQLLVFGGAAATGPTRLRAQAPREDAPHPLAVYRAPHTP